MQQNSSAKTAAPHWLTSIKNIFLDAIFPPKCLMCGHLFQSAATDPVSESAISQQRDVLFYAQRWLTELCCQSCLNAVAAISEPFCKHCGMMFNQPQADNAFCSDCMMQPHKFRMARAAIAYDAQSMVMIQRFKYTGKTQLAGPFGALLLYTFLRYWHPESIDLILPVPLHHQKFRRRGFNQAHLMLDQWQKMSTVKISADLCKRLRTDVLLRNKKTVPQTGLGRSERKENIEGAFSVQRSEIIAGKTVLLVDDVYTTGATVNECARLLLQSGAENVDVLTLARAV